jgi:hypothetical protein
VKRQQSRLNDGATNGYPENDGKNPRTDFDVANGSVGHRNVLREGRDDGRDRGVE